MDLKAPAMPARRHRHRAAAALAAVLLHAAAAATCARALTLKATATNCSDISEAFAQLTQAYQAATKSSPITLQLTMDCAGNFTCAQFQAMPSFAPRPANTTDGRQPAVTISVDAGPKCRKGDSRPLIDIGAVDSEGATLFYVYESYYPRTRVDLRVSNVRLIGTQYDYWTKYYMHTNTSSALTVKNIEASTLRGEVQFAGAVLVDGSVFAGAAYAPLQLNGVNDRIAIKGTTFQNNGVNGYPGAIWAFNLGPNVKVSVERNTFNANGGVDRAQVIYAGFNGDVSMSLKNNVFANSTGSPSVNATVCLTNGGTATRTPRVDVSRNTGLDPARRSSNKTAPWPTTNNCNVALFTQV